MQPTVVLVGLPGLLQDIVSAEIRKDPDLRLVPAAEVSSTDCVVAVGIADSPLQRVVASLKDCTSNVRVIALSEQPGDLFRFEMTQVARNASPGDLVAAIRAVAFEPWAQGDASHRGSGQ